ncbi:hypothetical protein HNP84_001635 [Thermocatellispora tengchongensis]|uniref:CBM2 domain-containing protein n=1 Tax=Thermocatellispora tengchongensis TaxID=1073253 RepID=A0A840NXJ0_9ACTN|nr:cellulose-binding domain-containing protein [Thermocatellispora tengchongensis]MBB5131922.1 hypothetical protein [Thermocatellispora tengchongensis]
MPYGPAPAGLAGLARRAMAALCAVMVAVVTMGVVSPAGASAGCRAVYTASQWRSGFTATVQVTNLGGPLDGWTLEWDFPHPSQTVVQGWNGTFERRANRVTVTAAEHNAALGTGTSVSPGFNGSWSGANPAPTVFTLNGVTCTGRLTSPVPSVTSRPDPWDPPAALAGGLAQAWRHVEDTYPGLYGFRNYVWDQIMANRGAINYCVRWDSDAKVTPALRDEIHAALARQFKKWIDALVEDGRGWNSWPYPDVPVRVVGWAVRERATLEWSDPSVDIYVGDLADGAPQCAPHCGRFFHQDGDYSRCPGGAARHYDMSLWLTEGMRGGAGGDWGQRIGSEYLVNALDDDDIHILLHEMGHGFGLDDFYDWTPAGTAGFLMKAGTATRITPFDTWMLRDWWRHLKHRYGY